MQDYPELKRSPPLKENMPSSRPIRPASADDARRTSVQGLGSSRASSEIGTPTREPSHTPEIISIKAEPPEPPDDQSESNFSVSTVEHGGSMEVSGPDGSTYTVVPSDSESTPAKRHGTKRMRTHDPDYDEPEGMTLLTRPQPYKSHTDEHLNNRLDVLETRLAELEHICNTILKLVRSVNSVISRHIVFSQTSQPPQSPQHTPTHSQRHHQQQQQQQQQMQQEPEIIHIPSDPMPGPSYQAPEGGYFILSHLSQLKSIY